MRFDRATALDRLATEEFDVVIVGGGITGAGCALDAVSRRLRTALVERGDFAIGTSSRSSKLVHGGIRYLEQKEFGDVPGVAAEQVKAMIDAGQKLQFIDARPKHYVSRTQDIIEGATWRDPERVKEWAGELSKSEPVVVFCVYGFHVGCQTAVALREQGFDASYMKGGHFAWRAMGGPVKLNT